MIKLIKPNVGLWISSEPWPATLQIVQNFAGWKLSAVYVNQTNLKVKWSKKLGGTSRGAAKNLGRPWPTQAPFRTATATLSLLCDVRYSTMEKLSWEFLIYCYIT